MIEILTKTKSNKTLSCVFIRINPAENFFSIFKAINKIHRHIKRSIKKSLIEKISKRLYRTRI